MANLNSDTYNLLNASVSFKSSEECRQRYSQDVGLIDYVQFIYCDFNNNFTAFGLFLYLSWLIILFITIGTVVDHFFCPSLEVLSKALKLSQNVAGVTFLAFGNGAPEIFSSVAGARLDRSKLVIAGLFGSAMFLTCIVAGTIMLMMKPFKMVERPFLRDVIFFTVVAFWTYVCLYYHKMTLSTSLSFIGVYVLYTGYVLLAHHIYKKYFKKREHGGPVLERVATVTSLVSAVEPSEITAIDDSPPVTHSALLEHTVGGTEIRHITSDEIAPWGGPPIQRHWESGEHHMTTNLLDDFDLFLEDDAVEGPDSGPFTSSTKEEAEEKTEVAASKIHDLTHPTTPGTLLLFLYGLCPVNYHLWPVSKWWNKLLQTLRSPIVLILKITIPIVNYNEGNRHHNWCRPLNALHCTLTPLFLLFAFDVAHIEIYEEFKLWVVFSGIGWVLTVSTMLFTVNSQPPRFHVWWAILGFVGSIAWMHIIATEIVSLLMTFGKILRLSDEILGLTILSWGNGIPDFIADVTVAKAGYPQMGISACFGGPLIIVLLGMGISFTCAIVYNTGDHIMVAVPYSEMTNLFCGFLCISLLSSLTIFPLMQFQTHKFYGIYLIFLYVVFLIVVMLHEFAVL